MVKEGDMKGANDKRLVPELRFPEFKKDWDVDSMQSIFDMKNGYTPSKSNPTYWDNGTIPWFRMEDIRKNGHILSDSIQHVTRQAVKNSGLFPAYSIIVATTATIGEHALVIVDSLANQRFTFLIKRKSFKDKINMMYFHHYMFIIDEWCKKNTNSGGLVSVNMPAFKQLLIPFPSLAEQQKIAECLSSIDEEISAIKEKVEQLKVHKKGLMQKLFPIAGKFVPELRFPEFRDSKNWKATKISDIFLLTRGNVLSVSAVKNAPTQEYKYPVYSSQTLNNGLMGYYNKKLYKDAITWTTDGANAGTVRLRLGYFYCTNVCGVLLNDSGYANKCISEIIGLRTKEYVSHVGNPKLMNKVMGEIPITIPPTLSEQQKIADCLSSIDELISLYENKVTVLEQHKKGLMQRLFPKL
ncbi:restriction endonuclease subunit S [Bacteroides acidifaciens]|uniref:restriction endonuclease subunit S n=1 Tax=Bacteroides acidifaciens TaxID=85831 RepID=UPI0025876FBF|nr:restriction endonuclease subunit S [Bacteroides acidifaciens]